MRDTPNDSVPTVGDREISSLNRRPKYIIIFV